ncbi:hypothetical protein J6I90_08225 [Pseudidiomarina sp. 1APP75-32.1]|uniref:AAA+ ATPase domain-containing protein n=1 Tax=Pseudidiomarina terrestris TaxID=2820060 RepID=A0AAW7QZL0_9GAMM|nr:hypothetical protein [Pseudidiomarina sp. 1APP75-32.1]MDN7124866.1 hypothetical protein [Pseudidiomarina sp. 1APP75-32.1]
MRTTNEPISINNKYKSSVRLDNLAEGYQDFVNALILHGTLKGTLTTICQELEGSLQRAFTITGPYGSGKSTLAGLLSGAISNDKSVRNIVKRKLAEQDAELLDSIESAFAFKSGWLVVKHVCGLDNPAKSITHSICSQLGFKNDRNTINSLSDGECIELIKEAISSSKPKRDGTLILLDEMGKALDYQSNSEGDLYFFQELADIAQQTKSPVVIIGFLHQAFSQYAKGKTALTQQEWAKVQGRYRDLGYNPTVDESLILIGDSIAVQPKVQRSLENHYSSLIGNVLNAFPQSFTNTDSLKNALPLDPVVSLMLGPISRRRFSQNERSIFGFLASRERFGFRWFLENIWDKDKPSLYSPELLLNYLEANLGHLITSSPDGKAWLETQDALKRASQKGQEIHSTLVTIIGLTTIFGQQYQLFATRELLHGYLSHLYSLKEIDKALAELASWALIIFRNRHSAFFVFQGSDLDINTLILDEVDSIREGVSWAKECTTPSHVLASSHYHKTGSMRWASTAFVESVDHLKELNTYDAPRSGQPFTCFALTGESLTKKALSSVSKSNPTLIIGCTKSVERLRSAATEVIAIRNIFKKEEKLSHDHIAQAELTNRLNEGLQGIADELDHLFAETNWYFQGKDLGTEPLSKHCSTVADQVFPDAPVIINELVNRSKPSGSANSATNKLMLIMLNQDKEKNLGFDDHTFPPEKGIYLSVLKSKGWHTSDELGNRFTEDWQSGLAKQHSDSYKIWKSGFDYIKRADRTVTVSELYDQWMQAPYGLTAGLCRIYALALMKSLEGKVAFYDKDSTQSFIFIPELDEVIVEKLHKHAHEVGVRYYEIDSVQTQFVERIAEAALKTDMSKADILSLAKEIVRQVHLLPSWVKKTSGIQLGETTSSYSLSREAKALRNAALRANDPFKLILEDIPDIFGLNSDDSKQINKLTVRLREALDDLSAQHGFLLDAYRVIIKREIGAEFDSALAQRCKIVAQSAHRPGVKEFAQRLQRFAVSPSNENLIPVMSTAMGVAERNWSDKHINIGLHEVHNFCRQFRREESFTRISTVAATRTLALVLSEPNGEMSELEGHIADVDSSLDIDARISTIESELNDLPDDARREILFRALTKYLYPVENDRETVND